MIMGAAEAKPDEYLLKPINQNILEGRLELWLNDKANVLTPGDCIIFDSRIPHALRGLDGKDALFLDVLGDKVLPDSISQGAAKE